MKEMQLQQWCEGQLSVPCEASQVTQRQRIYLPKQEFQETGVQSLGQEDPLEEEMATHSSIVA